MSKHMSREESAVAFIEVLEAVVHKMEVEQGPVFYNAAAATYCGLRNIIDQLKHEVKWEGVGLA